MRHTPNHLSLFEAEAALLMWDKKDNSAADQQFRWVTYRPTLIQSAVFVHHKKFQAGLSILPLLLLFHDTQGKRSLIYRLLIFSANQAIVIWNLEAKRTPYHNVAPIAKRLRWILMAWFLAKALFTFLISSLIPSISLYFLPSRVSARHKMVLVTIHIIS